MELQVLDQTIYYQIEYTKANSMKLELSREGHVTIKAPVGSKLLEIEAFVLKHSKPILKRYAELNQRVTISSQKSYEEESHFLFLGKAYTIQELGLSISTLSEEEIQTQLKKFYTAKTKEIIKQRVAHFEKQMGVKAKSTTIVNSPKTWGTCSSLKELTFNYKLSMAMPSVIDYVVIHELCHISHLNHDRSFYRLLGSYDKNFKEHEAYLAKIGPVMTI